MHQGPFLDVPLPVQDVLSLVLQVSLPASILELVSLVSLFLE
jgi:hypothetical protein